MPDCVKLIVYESDSFTLKTAEKPHIDLHDGGHMVLIPKRSGLYDITQLSNQELRELAWFQKHWVIAMIKTFTQAWIEMDMVNIQINGNWSAHKPLENRLFHVHFYGRAKWAKVQKYGESLNFPSDKKFPEFYTNNMRISAEIINHMRTYFEAITSE